jgi:hypothetical protein
MVKIKTNKPNYIFKIKYGVIFILFLISLILFFPHRTVKLPIKINEKIKDFAIGNIRGDNKEYLVVLTGSRRRKFGEEVIIYSIEDKKEIYREDYSAYNPWKIVIGDIDGDGKEEISIGVYKTSPLHPVMARRPFIYSFEGNKLEPKWRGSRLSKPFLDYVFFDIDEDEVDEIVAIEILEDNRKVINTYKWKGFGFESYLETEGYEDISDLITKDNQLFIKIKEQRKSYKALIKIAENRIKVERED